MADLTQNLKSHSYSTKDFNRIQKLDFFRNFFLGSVIPMVEVIMMLIMIKELNGGVVEKTLLVMVNKFSFLLGIPLALYVFSKKYSINLVLFIISSVAAISLFSTHWVESVYLYVILAAMVSFPYHGVHSLLSEIYNVYPTKSRGKRFVTSNMGLFLGSIGFAFIFNQIIEKDSWLSFSDDIYFPIILIASVSLFISGCFFLKIPQVRFTGIERPGWKSLRNILFQDKLFLYMLMIWNLFGIANLWLLSYRTNILVEERFGFNYDTGTVLILLTIVPEISYLLLNFPFAYLFDRFNFIGLRIFLNFLIMAYIYFFFFGTAYNDHLIAGIFYGASRAGGSLAWRLWVNKFVPTEKVSMYMTVHVGFTGVRMVLSPVVGLYALYSIGPETSATISLVMFGLSIILLLPLLSLGKKKFNY